MSDKENNILTNFLEDSSDKDAFEKEAMEGFESLASKEEAIELKKKTDARAEVLFQKKANKPFVWAAAAVLIIAFSLLIKFFLPSNELIKSNNIALNEKPAIIQDEKKVNEPTTETTVTKNTEQTEESKPMKRAEGKKDESINQKQPPAESSPMAKLNSSKEELNSNKDVEAEQASADVNTFSETAKSESFAGGVPVTATGNTGDASDKEVLAKQLKLKEKSTKKSLPSKVTNNAPAAPANVKLEDDLKETESNLYYIGGDKALIADLREKLKLIELNSPFDALITITDEKKITTVEFIDERDLSKDELKRIKNEIKSLEKFNFKVIPAKKTKFTYKIIYRP